MRFHRRIQVLLNANAATTQVEQLVGTLNKLDGRAVTTTVRLQRLACSA